MAISISVKSYNKDDGKVVVLPPKVSSTFFFSSLWLFASPLYNGGVRRDKEKDGKRIDYLLTIWVNWLIVPAGDVSKHGPCFRFLGPLLARSSRCHLFLMFNLEVQHWKYRIILIVITCFRPEAEVIRWRLTVNHPQPRHLLPLKTLALISSTSTR